MEQKGKITIHNFCIPYNTSNDVLTHIDNSVDLLDAMEEGPLIFLFAIGVNDVMQSLSEKTYNTSPDTFQNNIESIIKIAGKHTKHMLFVGLTNVDERKIRALDEYGINDIIWNNKEINMFANKLESICQDKSITYISINHLLSNNELPDGLHPNAEGHRKMFEKVKESVEDYMRKTHLVEL